MYVYWANSGDGTIMRVPVAGGEPIVLANGQDAPIAVTWSGDFVYWLSAGTGEIRKVAK